MFLKNRKIISKMKRSKVTDYAALSNHVCIVITRQRVGRLLLLFKYSVDPDETDRRFVSAEFTFVMLFDSSFLNHKRLVS